MRVLAALLFLISLAPPPAVEAQDPGPVVFSERMWMGSEASSADEWIELYNRPSLPTLSETLRLPDLLSLRA